MRKGCSIVLLVLGGWLLSSVGIVGLFPAEEGISPWVFVALFAALAAPLVLFGAWLSPGNRLAELGLTLMIAAGVAAFIVITMAAMVFDPAMKRFMLPPLPDFDFTSSAMIGSILLMAGGGYLLRRWGKTRSKVDPGSSPG